MIYNSVALCAEPPAKDFGEPLKVVFIGRASREKRYHLFQRTASACSEAGMNIRFFSVGNVPPSSGISSQGEILERNLLYKTISDYHLLLLCSSSEGLPLVISEAMACGLVPLATNVGGVKESFQDGISGLLINAEEEDAIVEQLVAAISTLDADRKLLQGMSLAALQYVQQHFSLPRFQREYLALAAEVGEGN